jgi:putative endonuclease
MTVYLIRFSEPLGNAKHQAQYYLGSCDDGRLDARLAEHRAGRGAAITRAAVQRGARLDVVMTWPGGRREEKAMKRRKNHAKLWRP